MGNMMLMRVYAFPLLFIISAVVVRLVFDIWLPDRLADSSMLAALAVNIEIFSRWASLSLLALGVLSALYKSFNLWQWYQGNAESCDSCGGIVSERSGRYGPYYHCLACGRNRKIYR
ncbi:hypothetical protein ABIE60_002557 [Marinobacterium sp. MBR-109]|jgi:hypothetical protein